MLDTLGRSYIVPKSPDGLIDGTARQLDVLQFHARVPFAPNFYSDTYCGAAPMSYIAEIRAELFAKNYVYKWRKPFVTPRVLDPTQKNPNPRDCLAPTAKGYEFLRTRRPTLPFIYPTPNFHQHYSSLIGASFMYAAKVVPDLIFEPSEMKLVHPNCPPEAKAIKTHHHVIGKHPNGLYADAPLFGLRYGKRHMAFHGFEADRASESLNSEKQNSIRNKFRRYEQYIKERLYFKRYGLMNINIPIITTSAVHMQNLIKLAKETIHPEYQHHFLFKTFDDYANRIDYPPLGPHMVTEPWHTTTGTFSILKTLGVSNDT